MTTTATITVSFTNPELSANAHLSAEVDSRPSGLNLGKNTFIPGTTAYLLVYKSANVTLVSAASSAGTLSFDGSVTTVLYTDELQFADVSAASLSVPIQGDIVSYKWIGRDLGTPVVSGDGKLVTVPMAGVGILSITYNAVAMIGALVAPSTVNGEVDFNILVLIKGEVVV